MYFLFFPLFSCSAGKESTCNAGDLSSIPGLGRSPGEGNGYPRQYPGLENSWVAKSQTQLSDIHTFTFQFILGLYILLSPIFCPLCLWGSWLSLTELPLLFEFSLISLLCSFIISLCSCYDINMLLKHIFQITLVHLWYSEQNLIPKKQKSVFIVSVSKLDF